MENMTFNTFKEYLEEELGKALPEGTELRFQEITKNNDIRLRAVTISEPGGMASPTVYLDEYFNIFTNGCPVSMIAHDIVQAWKEHRNALEFDMEAFRDFGRAREHIVFRLVNYEKNREMLEGCPHKRHLDLAAAFQYILPDKGGRHFTVLITDQMAQAYGTCTEELYQLAMENTMRLMGSHVQDLGDMLGQLAGQGCPKAPEDEFNMYVVTNNYKLYGATAMLYTEKLREFADSQGSDFYILPSSVHELILVPTPKASSGIQKTLARNFENIVGEINRTELNPTEILSDNVYYFDRETSEVRIA